VPVDHQIFEKINDVQMVWYQAMILEDEKEKYETLRDVAEHNAMFMNPEGVSKVREARENTWNVPDDKFKDTIRDMFGRELSDTEPKDPAKSYLDMELDEVNFIPYEDK
jgi:endo-beta-N-acetylglucosaminidase D